MYKLNIITEVRQVFINAHFLKLRGKELTITTIDRCYMSFL